MGALLLLCPIFFNFIRSFVVLGFIGMHLGFFLGMELGIFPAICIVYWIALMPSAAWDVFSKRVLRRAAQDLHDESVEFTRRVITMGVLLCVVMPWNIQTLKSNTYSVSRTQRLIALTLRLDQCWDMFAPYPMLDDGWFLLPATFADGSMADIWKFPFASGERGPVRWASLQERETWNISTSLDDIETSAQYARQLSRREPMPVLSRAIRTQRWRKFSRHLSFKGSKEDAAALWEGAVQAMEPTLPR